jgi:hypothetical protein
MNLATRLATVASWLGLGLSLSLSASAADDPFVGTWVLNVAQSKGPPGTLVEGTTVTITDAGGGRYKSATKVVRTGVNVQTEVVFAFDGKDYTPTSNPPPPQGAPETVQAYERMDAHTYKSTMKVAGQLVLSGLHAVSADGKTMTITMTGSGQFGDALASVRVFDKK